MNNEYIDLLNRIRSKYNRMSKGQKRISDFILNNYNKVAFMTASNLGDIVGVSESTVVRYANALGYDGYPKLQKALQESIKTKLTTLQRFEFSEGYSDREKLIRKVMNNDIENIRKTIDDIDFMKFDKAVNMIRDSKKIYIIGLRSSKVLAEYLAYYLNFIKEDVHLIPSGANDIYDQLINIKEDDTVIVFSFPRYSNRTLSLIEYVSGYCKNTIAITDSETAPIVPMVELSLTAKYSMTTFIDSFVAPMSIINSLIISLSVSEKNKLKENFDKLEGIWNTYNIYQIK